MAQKKIHNTIRTDKLEVDIAVYRGLGYYERAEALECLAKDIGAPIDYDVINKMAEEYNKLNQKRSI